SSRDHWPVVPTIRPNDCDLGHFFRVQRALTQSGALFNSAPAAQENAWPAHLVFREIQSRFRKGDTWICRSFALRDSKSCPQLRPARRARGRSGFLRIKTTERFFAGRRSGLRLHGVAIARRIVA